ncbi:MBOAT, membrane-bound O-acyltransferase family-domain-containing protein [Entophlyctis helioformis]|nr:MBOAT, membrane-bound O-acyltransferase family-domain-containing protein [Entophlyctis helioformis]
MSLRAFADAMGVPVEMVTMGVCLTIAFPQAALFKLIPSSQQRLQHVFSIVSTSLLAAWMFGPVGLALMVAPTLATYVLVRLAPRARWMPVLVFLLVMGHSSAILFATQILYANRPPPFEDVSTPVMMLAIKLSSFAWAVHDGTKADKDVHEEMKPYVIRRMPDMVEFFGFAFFFASVWVGPTFEYRFYHDFTAARIPSIAMPALKIFLVGAGCLVTFLVLDSKWNARYCREETFFIKYTFLERLLYIQIVAFSARAKLCAAWKVAESACIMTGIGYDGMDPRTKEHKFDRMENINIRGVELGENLKMMIENWNKNTNGWLRRYIYIRVMPYVPGGAAVAITNFTSALWHGFYPGYYLSFLSATGFIVASRGARKYFRPFFVTMGSPLMQYKRVYDILGTVCTMSILNYFFLPFLARRADASLRVWFSVGFLGHVIVAALVIGFSMGLGKALHKAFGLGRPPHVVHDAHSNGHAHVHFKTDARVHHAAPAASAESAAAAAATRNRKKTN